MIYSFFSMLMRGALVLVGALLMVAGFTCGLASFVPVFSSPLSSLLMVGISVLITWFGNWLLNWARSGGKQPSPGETRMSPRQDEE